MSVGTVTPRGRRITVDFDPDLADLIAQAAVARSNVYRRATASDIIREAVARFLLPGDGTNRSHNGTKSTASHQEGGSLS